jgi:hypothetical protein
VLLDDPIEAFGSVGRFAFASMLFEVLSHFGLIAVPFPRAPSIPLLAAARCPSPAVTAADRVTSEARQRAAELAHTALRDRAIRTIQSFETALGNATVDVATPALVLSVLEDHSVIIEWPLPGRRLGFALHESESDSGWFFASTPEWGNILASGALVGAPMEQLVGWSLAGNQ